MRYYRTPLDKAKKVKCIGFDYESIINHRLSNVQPYVLRAMVYDGEEQELQQYLKISSKGNKIKDLIRDIIHEHKPKGPWEEVYLVGFNYANFDNFMLYETALEYNMGHTGPFIVRNSVLGLRFEGIEVKDLFRFVMTEITEYVTQDVVSMMELWFNCKAASREMTELAIED
ncbi:hypothetical protein BGZ89_002204 [Linnemannia elongata]|nr:hypothetical protein BGZ89_002204 [Linnemannia elongata]